MKALVCVAALLFAFSVFASEVTEMFKGTVHRDIKVALKVGKEKNKFVLLVIYDPKTKDNSRIGYCFAYWIGHETTKELVHDSFVQCVCRVSHRDVKKYVPEEHKELESCIMLVLWPDGTVAVPAKIPHANPDGGLKQAKELIAQLKEMKAKRAATQKR